MAYEKLTTELLPIDIPPAEAMGRILPIDIGAAKLVLEGLMAGNCPSNPSVAYRPTDETAYYTIPQFQPITEHKPYTYRQYKPPLDATAREELSRLARTTLSLLAAAPKHTQTFGQPKPAIQGLSLPLDYIEFIAPDEDGVVALWRQERDGTALHSRTMPIRELAETEPDRLMPDGQTAFDLFLELSAQLVKETEALLDDNATTEAAVTVVHNS